MNEKIERSIGFATSNSHKFREVELVLRRLGVGVRRLRGKGLEIQSDDVVEVARFASADASKQYGRPLIVEHTGLCIPAGHRHTMAQLSIDEKCRISHRAEAMTKFGEWYVRLVGNVYQPNLNDSRRADGRRHGSIRTDTGSRT